MKLSSDEVLLTMPVGPRDHVMGSPAAGVTLVEYGDYECTLSGQAHPLIKAALRDFDGRLRFVFRNFPVSQIHPQAQHAAEAAEAAGAQNLFWEMHDSLYQHQGALDNGNIVAYAVTLGMDPTRFLRDMSQHIHARQVREDFMSGLRSGVNSTPTFFINGARHDNLWDAQTLIAAISGAAEGSHDRDTQRAE